MKKNGIYPAFLQCMAVIILLLAGACRKEGNEPSEIKDGDGNVYTSITIGTQVWLKENLKTSSSNDGGAITLVTDGDQWANLKTPGFCWFLNDESAYRTKYGALYNWYAVSSGKICPQGWHVPSLNEWETLTAHLGGELIAGSKLKEQGTTYWSDPNIADNSSGFSARGGGYRNTNGSFEAVLEQGYWWTTSATTSDHAWAKYVTYSTQNTYKSEQWKDEGFSVRCVKD